MKPTPPDTFVKGNPVDSVDQEVAVIPLVRQLSREDFGKSAVRISEKGELTAPVARQNAK